MTDSAPRIAPPTPARNAALWLLALFSGGLAFLGAWVILDRLPGMEAVLDDGTATPSQVYGGQSWVVVGAVVLGAGLVGLALTLAVAARLAARRSVTPAVELVELPSSTDAEHERAAGPAADPTDSGPDAESATTQDQPTDADRLVELDGADRATDLDADNPVPAHR